MHLSSRFSRKAVTVRAAAQTVPVTITVTKKVEPGTRFKLVGNQSFLGKWDVSQGVELKWSEGHQWSATSEVPVGVDVNFKVVRVTEGNEGSAEWEGGDDRKFKVLGPEFGLGIGCSWNDTQDMQFSTYELQGDRSNGNGNGNGTHDHSASTSAKPTETSDDSSASVPAHSSGGEARGSAWQGAAPEMVRDKLVQQRKDLKWETKGLASPVAVALVEGDKKAGSWRLKLDLQKRVLVDSSPMARPSVESLALVYAYSTWVNTGAVACSGDSGHHRPNHHATLALQMFRSLEWVIGDSITKGNSVKDPEMAIMAARRMHERLPSFSGEFRQSVPFTRIRDIAHRNDIPQDLKHEIKHTLQNKLHSNAGPEDLVATEAMLVKVTRNPGEFNRDFVEEFKIFTRELREFFNATGLVDLLQSTVSSLDEAHASAVQQFLAAKAKVDADPASGLEVLVPLMGLATQARAFYVSGMSAGLRNDVTDDILALRQRWRLAELRLEEFSFMILARVVGMLEAQDATSKLATGGNTLWSGPLSALTHGLRNLGLSYFAQTELLALEGELEAWHGGAPLVATKDNSLRLKATLERVMRLTGDFSERLMEVYAAPASALGNALGVAPHMSRVFGESEIRSSMAFQVSRIASLLLKSTRLAAGLDAWDGLVTGEAVGMLVEVESLSPEILEQASSAHPDSPLVLLVRRADGDEELGPLGWRLKGVVLRQELAHLSHLGVRARQEKVPFATVDDEDYVSNSVRPLLGKRVRLSVTPGGVSLQEASSSDGDQGSHGEDENGASSSVKQQTARPGGGDVVRASTGAVVTARRFTLDTCGSKALKCGALESMAKRDKQFGFKTPIGVCLPFGVMDLALEASPGLHGGSNAASEASALLQQIDGEHGVTGHELEAACNLLQALVRSATVPAESLTQLAAAFPASSLLAVRSSANVEDLAGMSAAGLYESVVGVPVDDNLEIAKAVGEVWASLYSRRAVLSRRSAGVPQSSASMAVLVQQLFVPEVSFVLHSQRPRDSNPDYVLAEVAPGQGETLASGTRGTPWRFEISKSEGTVSTLAFANFSKALQLPKHKSSKPGLALVEVEVDYSRQRMSMDADYRLKVAQQLGRVAVVIEGCFDGIAQDIEGGLVGTGDDAQLYIFQTRPQV